MLKNEATVPSSLTRRTALKAVTATVLSASFARRPTWAQASEAGRARYKVLWNDDTTNIPKWTPGEVFEDSQLRAAIDSVADKGVDAYLLSPGLGWIPWWKSKVYPDHYQWRSEVSGVKPDCFGKYLLAGGDLVRTLIDHCRQRRLAPFVSYRLNDNHHQEQRHSVWVSRFYEEHPEYLLNPEHYKISGYSKDRGQNWAIPAVREYKLALIRELCENYDYLLGNVPYYRQVPVTLTPGQTHVFTLDMAPSPPSSQKRIRLRIHAETPLEDVGFEVTLAGRRLQPCNDVSAFFNNPYDDMLSTAAQRRAFRAGGLDLKNGINELTVTPAGMVRVVFLDVMVETDA